MNAVDGVVLLVIATSATSGARRGVIGAAGDLVAIALGLAISALGYPLPGAIFKWLGLPDSLASMLGFIAMAIAVVAAVGWGFSWLAAYLNLPRRTSRLGGGVLGAVMGVMLASLLVLGSGLITRAAEPVQQSLLGSRLITVVPRLHVAMESVGIPLPKLVQLPTDYREEVAGARQGLQFLRINSVRLNGAMCIHCRSAVVFEGYKFSRGTLLSPLFRCPHCGRISDGCQSFEGFHTIYGICPTELADDGVQFDCGVWMNGWWTVPHGRCPVCGKEHQLTAEEARLGPPPNGRESGFEMRE